MEKLIKLDFVRELERLGEDRWGFIKVILGPRQVGKTTGIKFFLNNLEESSYYYKSADGEISKTASWFEEQWNILKSKNSNGFLIIDEIQKIENWSEIVKKLWDEQKFKEDSSIKLILLGSSSLTIQKGLSESLAGRFEILKVQSWNSEESFKAYNLSFEDFLIYGGYPGSYSLIENKESWLQYMREAIVETVIGKDILQISRVKSPALFKQCFDLACSYGGQEISYTKLLGQLQDKGNVELVKHYLELLEGSYLLRQLPKYSAKKFIVRASSPKILPLRPALYTITKDAVLNSEERGRAFEIAVGAELNRLPGRLYYWREGDKEVDFVYEFGKKTVAIEVKSGKKTQSKGMSKFLNKFPHAKSLIITPANFKDLQKLLDF